MKHFSNLRAAAEANVCLHAALVFIRNFKGSIKDLDEALSEEFNLCAVVREELINLILIKRELNKLLESR